MDKGMLRKVNLEVWTTEEEGCVSTLISDHLGDKFYICEDGDAPTEEIPEGPREYFKLGEVPEKPATDRELAGHRKFQDRLDRLQRLYDLSAPGVILANEAVMVLEAVRLLHPEEVAHAEGKRALELILRNSRLCVDCEKRLPAHHVHYVCPDCSKIEE